MNLRTPAPFVENEYSRRGAEPADVLPRQRGRRLVRRARGATITLAAVLVGCSSTSLSPGPGVTTKAGTSDVAVSQVDGVAVSVQANAWAGDARVRATVQPIRVTIDNNGDVPIRIRYGDFALISPSGKRYAALPPFRVEGQILNPRLAAGYMPYPMPGFRYRRFYVAPYFSPLYPGIPVFTRPYFFYDPFYYNYYYMGLSDAIRPTMEMLSLALPEGVIEPGGGVQGFLYFEKVDRDLPMVTFRQDLVAVGSEDGETGAAGADFGQISIPFTVTTTKP